MGRKLTTTEFITRAKKIHGNKYDYSNVEYVKSHDKVEIICPIHGAFFQTPNNHLTGFTCKECSIEIKGKAQKDTLETFIEKAIKVHGTKYDYKETVYIESKSKVNIFCNFHKINFLQIPNCHLMGQGCPKCGEITRWKKFHNKPTTLYYFKIKDVWKVGITTTKLKDRYRVDYNAIEDLITWEFSNGKDAYTKEQEILLKYAEYKYTGESPFKGKTGITECFSEDVYKLWEESNEPGSN